MTTRGPYAAVLAGLLVALGLSFALLEGLVLGIESTLVAVVTGLLAGGGVGTVVLLVAPDGLPPRTHNAAIAAGVFAWVALVVLFGVSSTGVANETALLAGLGVGALVGIGTYVYLRDQAARDVKAVTMR